MQRGSLLSESETTHRLDHAVITPGEACSPSAALPLSSGCASATKQQPLLLSRVRLASLLFWVLVLSLLLRGPAHGGIMNNFSMILILGLTLGDEPNRPIILFRDNFVSPPHIASRRSRTKCTENLPRQHSSSSKQADQCGVVGTAGRGGVSCC